MKAIKAIYDEKANASTQAQRYNPFNRGSNDRANQHMSDASSQSASSGFSRKRKFNEMSCDSPQSDRTQSNDEEEDKDSVEEKKAENCTDHLIGVLNRVQSEDDARAIIKNSLISYKRECSTANSNSKSKISDKEKHIFKDFVKKLNSDNSILKKGILKLVEKEQQNALKIQNFDKLAQCYNDLKVENERLRSQNQIVKLKNSADKCNISTYGSSFDNNGPGSGGVF